MYLKETSKRLISYIVIVMTLLVMLSSFLFIVEHADHHCTNQDCPICATINQCVNNIQQMGLGTAVTAVTIVVAVVVTYLKKSYNCLCEASTLISSKVRLND